MEGVVGTLDEAWKLGRNKTLFLVLAAVLLLSLPPLLSYGAHAPWASIRLWDRSIFVFAEYVVTALLMPVGALLMSVFVALASPDLRRKPTRALRVAAASLETGNHLSWRWFPVR